LNNSTCLFIDTGLEYDCVRRNALELADVVIRPKKSFEKVIMEYGYPVISKEVSNAIHECQTAKRLGKEMPKYRVDKLKGVYIDKRTGQRSKHNMVKWGELLNAPFRISHRCCDILKKEPSRRYEKQTDKKVILGLKADDSSLRLLKWTKFGCNAFYEEHPSSSPLSFWTDQDILKYIKLYNLKIPEVYGDIVEEIKDGNTIYKTTGAERTGCSFCMFGIANDKDRFLRLKELEPKKYDYVMRGGKFDEYGYWIPHNGLGFKFVIDWLNENLNLSIKY